MVEREAHVDDVEACSEIELVEAFNFALKRGKGRFNAELLEHGRVAVCERVDRDELDRLALEDLADSGCGAGGTVEDARHALGGKVASDQGLYGQLRIEPREVLLRPVESRAGEVAAPEGELGFRSFQPEGAALHLAHLAGWS